MSIQETEKKNVILFDRKSAGDNTREIEDWLSPKKQEAVFLARFNKAERVKRGISATHLMEFHVVDRDGSMRLLRVVEDYFGKDRLGWVDPKEFCREMEWLEDRKPGLE